MPLLSAYGRVVETGDAITSTGTISRVKHRMENVRHQTVLLL